MSEDSKPNIPKESNNIIPAADCNYSVEVQNIPSSQTKTSPAFEKDNFTCNSCSKVYATRAGLYKHDRIYHPNKTTKSIACSESDCKCVFKTLQQYRKHLKGVHDIPMEIFTKSFNDNQGMQYNYTA